MQLTWLVRRASRMSWQEVPFRVASVVQAALQRCGLCTAASVPERAPNQRYGAPWCQVPLATADEQLRLRTEEILGGELTAFGQKVPMPGGVPNWHEDPVTGIRLPMNFGLFLDFRHIPGLDIKHLWEVNRLQWWVPLAQGWALWRDSACLGRLGVLLDSWLTANPYALGPNWSSPVEHGVRLINWSLTWHLMGGETSPLFNGDAGVALRERWLGSVFQHMRFASDNYSFYSSADNHLIGEAAGVFVAAHTWDCWEEGRRLRRRAKQILEEEALKQFSEDGVNLEQAVSYHKFSLQFLLAAGLCGRANGDDFSPAFWTRIESAIVFLAAITDTAGQVPRYGDSDDGDVWRLAVGPGTSGYQEVMAIGARIFGNEALRAKCQALRPCMLAHADWVGDADSVPPTTVAPADSALTLLPREFPIGGYVLLGKRLHAANELRVLMDCGPLGYNHVGGHAHADALSVLVSVAGEEILVDPGTYCYNAAPELRHFFRGTTAHNTLTIDGEDQSIYGASFLWLRDVHTTIEHCDLEAGGVVHAHHDGYRRLRDPVRHHRRVVVGSDDTIVIEDWLECVKPHTVSLAWHCAAGITVESMGDEEGWLLNGARNGLRLKLSRSAGQVALVQGQEAPPQGWVSPSFYCRHPAPVLIWTGELESGEILQTTMTPVAIRSNAMPK